SVRNKLNAFLSHEIDAPLDDGLVELHVGNPVHQQPTDAVGTLVYGYPVTGTVQLRCTGKPRRTRTNHSHLLASTLLRRICAYPAFGKSLVDDRTLNVLDRHRQFVDPQHTRPFTRSRTHTSGKLRKIVSLMQPLQRFSPQATVDQVIPLWDEVVDRTPRSHT